jgi:hypothetical protein
LGSFHTETVLSHTAFEDITAALAKEGDGNRKGTIAALPTSDIHCRRVCPLIVFNFSKFSADVENKAVVGVILEHLSTFGGPNKIKAPALAANKERIRDPFKTDGMALGVDLL